MEFLVPQQYCSSFESLPAKTLLIPGFASWPLSVCSATLDKKVFLPFTVILRSAPVNDTFVNFQLEASYTAHCELEANCGFLWLINAENRLHTFIRASANFWCL